MILDPNKPARDALSLNEQLLAQSILHAVYLERLKNSQVRRIIGLLNDDVLPEIIAQVVKRYGSKVTFGSIRYQQMLAAVLKIVKAGFAQVGDELRGSARDLSIYEANWTVTKLRQLVPVEIDFVTPSLPMLRAAVDLKPIQGQVLKDWVDDLGVRSFKLVKRQIGIGMAQGETLQQITTRLQGDDTTSGVFEGTRRELEALTRTITSHVANDARMTTFEENDDIVKGYQWTATLDHGDGRPGSGTCIVCGARDGTVYAKREDVPPIPAHFNCRCAVFPVLKSFKELGFTDKDAPEGTRASMDGQVPDSMTYEDWLAGQPEEIQVEVLGATRAKLFRSGQLKLPAFINKQGQVMTLADLAKAEGIEIE